MNDTDIAEEVPTVALDGIAHFVDLYRKLDHEIRQLEETREAVRKEIQTAMGDNQIGTVAGRKAVRWTTYTQRRLSTTAIRKKFDAEDLADCYVSQTLRRFVLADGH